MNIWILHNIYKYYHYYRYVMYLTCFIRYLQWIKNKKEMSSKIVDGWTLINWET